MSDEPTLADGTRVPLSAAQEAIEDLEDELDTAQAKIAALEAELATLRAERWQPVGDGGVREFVACICQNDNCHSGLDVNGHVVCATSDSQDPDNGAFVFVALPDDIRLFKRSDAT